ncbi:MAG: hypothetical protein PVI86_05700 [Phycisphaerae bacterium]|jgi:hypothetical protein
MDGITDSAGVKLHETLDQANASPEQFVRLEVTLSKGGTLKIDNERPDDVSFEFNDRKVLILDKQAAETYAGRKLDFAEGKFCVV